MLGEYRVVPPGEDKDAKSSTQGVLIWRVINAVMAVFFLLAAYVNLNDDDWYIWVPVYTVPGVLSLVSCVKPNSPNSVIWSYCAVAFLGTCVALIIYIIVSAAELQRTNNPLQSEEGREMTGVLIMMTWVGIARFTNIGRPGGQVNNNVLRNALLFMVCTLAIAPVIIWSLCLHDYGKGYFHHCKGMFEHRTHEL